MNTKTPVPSLEQATIKWTLIDYLCFQQWQVKKPSHTYSNKSLIWSRKVAIWRNWNSKDYMSTSLFRTSVNVHCILTTKYTFIWRQYGNKKQRDLYKPPFLLLITVSSCLGLWHYLNRRLANNAIIWLCFPWKFCFTNTSDIPPNFVKELTPKWNGHFCCTHLSPSVVVSSRQNKENKEVRNSLCEGKLDNVPRTALTIDAPITRWLHKAGILCSCKMMWRWSASPEFTEGNGIGLMRMHQRWHDRCVYRAAV